jgi:hypothetical protein
MKPERAALQAAFDSRKSQRKDWPATLDDALAIPLYRVIIETIARHQGISAPPTIRKPLLKKPALFSWSQRQGTPYKNRVLGEKDD